VFIGWHAARAQLVPKARMAARRAGRLAVILVMEYFLLQQVPGVTAMGKSVN